MPIKRIELYDTLKTENPKFEKYNGLPKMSYSAYTSWIEDAYRGSFIAAKFLGIPDGGNIFTDFGSACGQYLETRNTDNPKVSILLSNSDIEILNKVDIPDGSIFEKEIVLIRDLGSMGAYCIIGYIDMFFRDDVQKVCIVDFKTGSSSKSTEYGSSDYNQTRLYSYALETEEQEDIGYVGVELLHRKGNNLIPGDKNVLRLEGEIEQIITPYDNLETAKFLKEKFDVVAIDISDNIKFFKKFFAE
jgi:hypothetical protein